MRRTGAGNGAGGGAPPGTRPSANLGEAVERSPIRPDQRVAFLTNAAVLPGERHLQRGPWGDGAPTVTWAPSCGGEVVLLPREAFHQGRRPLVGLLASVDDELGAEGRVRHADAYGLRRIQAVAAERRGPVLVVHVQEVDEEATAPDEALARLLRLRRQVQRQAALEGSFDLIPDVPDVSPGYLADMLAVRLRPADGARLALLSAVRWTDRLPILEALYRAEARQGHPRRPRQPRREKTLEDRVRGAALPADVRQAVRRDLAASGGRHGDENREAVKIILDLAWKAQPPPAIDIRGARQVLDASHTGLETAKRAVLDHLVVLEWQRRHGRSSLAGPALCLVGPPGTGKTTLAEVVATAMGRRFERISLGGVDDVSLVGADRGYTRARPGEFVRRLRVSGVHPSGVVWLLDEIDKLADWGGHAALPVLLSLLDPSQNHAWQDRFLDEVRLDFSGSVFLATANERAQIPGPLLDRLRCIDVPAYSQEDQVRIGQTKLLPKLLGRLDLGGAVAVDEAAMRSLVFEHPRSPGCRQLEQRLQVILARAIELHMETGAPVAVDVARARAWVPPARLRGIGFQMASAPLPGQLSLPVPYPTPNREVVDHGGLGVGERPDANRQSMRAEDDSLVDVPVTDRLTG